jgi:hypothetical protein
MQGGLFYCNLFIGNCKQFINFFEKLHIPMQFLGELGVFMEGSFL